jgi:hypothetical protein
MSGRGRVRPKLLGESSQLHVYAALAQAGYAVSVPLGDSQRYDCIADDGRRLLRIQIKTGYDDGHGAIRWATRSTKWNGGPPRT